jgi:hypothetical protein
VVRRGHAHATSAAIGQVCLNASSGDVGNDRGLDPVKDAAAPLHRLLDIGGSVVPCGQVALKGGQVLGERLAAVLVHRVRQADLAAFKLLEYLRLQHGRGGLVGVRPPLLPLAVGHAEADVPPVAFRHNAVTPLVERERDRMAARTGPLGALLAAALDDDGAGWNRPVVLPFHKHGWSP